MALTAAEEALVRELIAQNPELLSLAGNEATIISKLGATKKNLSQLAAALSLNDTDLLFTRQGTSDKSVALSVLKAYAQSGIDLSLYMPKSGGNYTGPANANKGADIASASTTNIGAANGEYVTVTGNVTITALGMAQSGAEREVTFAGTPTLTHNATRLILPTAENITVAAGDTYRFRSLGSGNWRCVGYSKANGKSLVDTAFSSTAENQSGTVNNKSVSPLGIREAFNATGNAPVFACRVWLNIDGTAAAGSMIRGAGNVSSMTDNGIGNYRANFLTALPDETYSVVVTSGNSGTSAPVAYLRTSTAVPTASDVTFGVVNTSATAADCTYVCLTIHR